MKHPIFKSKTTDTRGHVQPCAMVLLVASTFAVVQCFGIPAQAQNTSLKDSSVIKLDPIKVTVRKLEENLQNVPISTTVVGKQALEDRRIDNLEGVLREVPGIGFSSLGDGRSTFLSVRGIGPLLMPIGYDDTSTVTYVDGVPQPLFGSDLNIIGAERIEVMRGPQGTVFGRNTQAGAINIVTQRPGDQLEVSARSELGTNRHRLGQASVSGPLKGDILAGRLAVSYSGIDGDVDNTAPGAGNLGEMETGAVRGSLIFTPSPDTKITLSLFGQRDDNRPSNFILKGKAGFPVVAANPEGGVDRKLAGLALTASHDFSDVTLTSVTATNYYKYSGFTNNSEAFTFSQLYSRPVKAYLPATDYADIDERQTSFYQEVRLSSEDQADILWVGGLSYYHDDFDRDDFYKSAFGTSVNGTRNNDYSNDSYAVFGEITAPVPNIKKLKLTTGLRYTRDEKKYKAHYRTNGHPRTVARFNQSGSLDFNLITGRAILAYELAETSNLYASVSRGARSGGFPNFTSRAATGKRDKPYDKSTSWAYEIGTKNLLLDGDMRLNASLFFNDVKNNQLNVFTPDFTLSPKSIDTESYGAELETGYRLMPGLDLLGSATLMRAKIKNISAEIAKLAKAKNGNRVSGTPNFTSSIGLQYRTSADKLNVSNADLFSLVQHQYIGSRAADVGNKLKLDAYHVLNARLGLEFDHFNIYAFGQNITNERPEYIGIHYGKTPFTKQADTVAVGHGRVIGIGTQFRF